MKEQEFTLILSEDPNEEEADRLYGIFDDGTLSTIAGVPQVCFHWQAPSLEEAIRTALKDLTAVGFEIAHVEIEPQTMMQPA